MLRSQLAGVWFAAFDTRIMLATIDSPVQRFMVSSSGLRLNANKG